MKLFQLLLLFAFPTSIFGIQCAVGGVCHHTSITNISVDVPIKTCKDACVYFKCFGYYNRNYVIEGYGCLESFLSVCKHTPTNVKEVITKNLKNYSISNDDLIFRSCSDKDECSTNGSKTWTTDNVEFNIGPIYYSYNDTVLCPYISLSSKRSIYSKNHREISCQSGKLYFFSKSRSTEWIDHKIYSLERIECDACLMFQCTNDNGNTVVRGGGCWNDFIHACPSVPTSVKEGIKRNINDSFYYDKNYIITTCGYRDCGAYEYFNPSSGKMFMANVNKTFDEICLIDYPENTPPTSATSAKKLIGIQCAVGGDCHEQDEKDQEVLILRKTCLDSCVYFKCISYYYGKPYIMEGAGCYDDFDSLCQYTSTKQKDKIKENLEKYSIENEVLIFRSCSDKNGCATNGFNNLKFDKKSNGIFGSLHQTEKHECPYDFKSSKLYFPKRKCGKTIGCRSAKEYKYNEWFFDKKGDAMYCNACVEFVCSNDGGNTVVQGDGCWDDFEYACPIVPNEIKEGIKRNINNSFYYDKNYIVYTCNGDCFNVEHYVLANPDAVQIFETNLNRNYDKKCHVDLLSIKKNESNVFKVYGIFIVLGLTLFIFDLLF